MGSRMISAAKTAGINITLVPIFIKRWIWTSAKRSSKAVYFPDIESYLRLLESSKEACNYYDGANIGIGIHSLRAWNQMMWLKLPNRDHKIFLSYSRFGAIKRN